MRERPRDQERSTPSEPTGLPADLFDDPGKYDGDIPLWKRTVGFLKQLAYTRPQNRNVPFDQLAASIVKVPSVVSDVLNNFSLISQIMPELRIESIKYELSQHIDSAMASRKGLRTWTPEKIQQLIRINLETPETDKFVTERMITSLFNAPQTVDEAVDFYYNAAWAMVDTSDHQLREEIFSILCFERKHLTADDRSSVYFGLGVLALNDTHLVKYYAAMDAIDHVGIYLETISSGEPVMDSERAWRRVRQYGSPTKEAEAMRKRLVQEIYAKDPARFNKIVEGRERKENLMPLGDPTAGRNYLEATQIRQKSLEEFSEWPDNITIEDFGKSNEPLRKKIFELIGPLIVKSIWENRLPYFLGEGYEKLNEKSIEFTEGLEVDLIAKDLDSLEQKNAVIREVIMTFLAGNVVNPSRKLYVPVDKLLEIASFSYGLSEYFDSEEKIYFAIRHTIPAELSGRLSSILEYHRPILTLEQVSAMETHTVGLRDDLYSKFTRSVGKRGYQIIIADSSLKTFGYESMSFRQEGNDINVSLQIDSQIFEFLLDSGYRIKSERDIKRFLSPQDQAWLELLTLSHLKKLMCTEEDSLSDEMVGGKKQHEYYRKQKIGRIEHLRRLPPGQNFSSDAYLKCLKSTLPIRQLDRINRMRAERGLGGTRETGIWTYIPGVERDIDTGQAKPFKISFTTAADDIRKIIPLGEISKEERKRIEREILEEFENL